ncbi:DUF1963 domain-containing protein [Marinitenerispora sediminis]|uniref:DUF1963 domain-containing protein n=1 Tax=Marinitenerispora sediminis TaxID=1931232 RepID=A0A368TAM3_9ACTN|nr:DUF1963 domain-containing protein [Marinitenerispora sediminis]RCV55895.1 DUF1963 domain-containing protein [Marinitenerispora sediminis]RCV61982.1 DUF1963 domain-containing protein [Marinitenerispora sediminis]RCV62025.1 DUF1963 domain-containing protein [Marinitenerispora sediminis]
MDRRQEFRAHATEYGVAEATIEWALRFALPQIELRPREHSPGPVVGQYGGLPLLPPDVEWSSYPHFFASVDCAALPGDVLDLPLPKDGHLLFFGNKDEPEWGDDSEDTEGRIVYVPAGTPTAEREPDAGHAAYVSEPFPLHGHPAWNLPSAGHDVIESDEERAQMWEELGDIGYDNSSAGELTLGGHASPIWDDPCLPPYPGGDDRPWRLLAQAHIPARDDKSSMGTIFWLMRPEDIAEGRFDRAKVRLEMYPPE